MTGSAKRKGDRVAAVIIVALIVAGCRTAARHTREFPADGQHAPRGINQNRGDRR